MDNDDDDDDDSEPRRLVISTGDDVRITTSGVDRHGDSRLIQAVRAGREWEVKYLLLYPSK